MSAKPITEHCAKGLIAKHVKCTHYQPLPCAKVNQDTIFSELVQTNPWLNTTPKLVVKPDQQLKRRGKLGLLAVGVDFAAACKFVETQKQKELTIGNTKGIISRFIIEPFLEHKQEEEFYLSFISTRRGNEILFYHQGGVDVGDVDSKCSRKEVEVGASLSPAEVLPLLAQVNNDNTKKILSEFISELFSFYDKLNFTLLEVNPLVVVKDKVYVLDVASKLDETAEFECAAAWGHIEFPVPFGREPTPEEAYISDLDKKSGASLKLTILNPHGRIWTMVAGGGASVIYSDTICDLGGASELANYGEYSGAPTESQTYDYARTILSLITRTYPTTTTTANTAQTTTTTTTTDNLPKKNKVLIIGGGIANFTNVAATFKGIEKALREFGQLLKSQKVEIFVRRGGPNFQEGLRLLQGLGESLGIPIHVYGPETHMTAIVPMALGLAPSVSGASNPEMYYSSFPGLSSSSSGTAGSANSSNRTSPRLTSAASVIDINSVFSSETKAIIYGMQPGPVQRMLDFDTACRRTKPSVAAMVYPFSGNHMQKFYWGTEEILIPVYKELSEALSKHSDASVLINFASQRSAAEVTEQALKFPQQIKVIAIIAEKIPERKTKLYIKQAKESGVLLIGPATVGGIKPGCFRIGNTGGALDNILSSKLYRPGSVAYVSRSGGMSNELNNIISRSSDGVYEGVAIGGDRYPGSGFLDHLVRYQADPNVKILVLLGEVGGIEEYDVCDAIKRGLITKPIVAWCIGTCATMFASDVQFGHAGALAHGERETARAKNAALKEAGAHVPSSFNDLGQLLNQIYQQLLKNGTIQPFAEPIPPKVPVDYSWAQELGLIRKPKSFISTISDERGEELLYAGMPISNVFQENIGIGGVVSLLWFKRRLPEYASNFIEMCLMVTADHGPAVSGAHNTIVASRAGKDLVSSLCSGLLTIGDRFGGALDGAAKQFSEAFDRGFNPQQFVDDMRKKQILIMGIGHRVKSLNDPDKRVEIIKRFAREHFPSTPLLDFAEQVELITTAKKPNLILNVDGTIAVCFVDLLRTCGAFTLEAAREFIELGSLNGLFVLGRSIGLIGHWIDQQQLKQGLYRHPWDDITYLNPTSGGGNANNVAGDNNN